MACCEGSLGGIDGVELDVSKTAHATVFTERKADVGDGTELGKGLFQGVFVQREGDVLNV